MNRRKSLDDTCDVFLSRRRVHSHFSHLRTTSECPPKLCPENLTIAPYFNLLPRPLEVPEPSGTVFISGSTKPLPLPGSSGTAQPRPTRLPDGRSHVPRPRNPFILFRCDLVHQRKMLPRSDLDDTNISRIAGDLWREMTGAQKKPWVDLAAKEKVRHALLYPDYKYAPTHGGTKSKKGKDDHAFLEERPPRQVSQIDAATLSSHSGPRRRHERPRPYPQLTSRRRPSSCPPVGAVPVQSLSPVDEWTPPLVTRDDLERRPSRTIMYQSAALQTIVEPAPHPADPDSLSTLPGFDWLSNPQIDPSFVDHAYPLPDINQSPYASHNFDFLDKPILFPSIGDRGFTAQELDELERLTLGTTFTDPFSTFTAPMSSDSPFTLLTGISPLDCNGYSSGSPASTSSSSGVFSN